MQSVKIKKAVAAVGEERWAGRAERILQVSENKIALGVGAGSVWLHIYPSPETTEHPELT